jgi:hypothetical protein
MQVDNSRNILPWMTEELPQLNSDHEVCDTCHKISKLKCVASNKQKDDDSVSDEIEHFAKTTAMQSLNESLQSIGELPIKKKRQGEGMYPTSKIKRTEKAVKQEFLTFLKMSIQVQFLYRLMLRFENS